MDLQTIMLAMRVAQMIKQARESSGSPQSEDMSGGFTEMEMALIEQMIGNTPDETKGIMVELIYNMLRANNPDYHFPQTLDSEEKVRLRTDDDPPAPRNFAEGFMQSRKDDDGEPLEKAWNVLKSEGYDGESAESECAICGKRNTGGTPDVVRPSGSGMHVCTRPNMEDYLPGDGEGYAGHMLQYQQCQRQARGE